MDRVVALVGAASEALAEGWSAYIVVVEALLGSMVGGDLVIWNSIDLSTRLLDLGGSESETWRWLLPALGETAQENPLLLYFVKHAGWPPPVRMSDLVTDRQAFRRSRLFGELWTPLGVRHQAGLATVAAPSLSSRGWAINRSKREFSEKDLTLLGSLQRALGALEDHHLFNPGKPAAAAGGRSGAQARQSQSAQAPPFHSASLVRPALTSREQQVLRMVATGWTAVHIAHVLRVSPGTVRKHLEHVYSKLGVHDRLLAVERARGLGFVP